MKKILAVCMVMLVCALSTAPAMTLCSGVSSPVVISIASGTRTAARSEIIRYSTAWETSAAGAMAVVTVNGETLESAAGTGSMMWRPTRTGSYTFTHKVMSEGMQVGSTLIATFEVREPATPVITPADWTILEGPVSVLMSCATEGATLHYTTDGTDPTEDSPVYRRFRVSEKTTVKAVAVKDGVCSEVAVAEYALGQCAAPVITAAAAFTGSKTSVELSCATEGATIRYTTDGSDPDGLSALYTEPFDVTNSCMVKAYATYETFFDSPVASFEIEKVWGIGDTMGDPDQVFTVGGDLPFFRVTDATAPLGEAMQSGAITHNQSSTMTTTVDGAGTVSFLWRTSCEKDDEDLFQWDHAEFEVDGAVVAQLDGVTEWQTVSQPVAGAGPHTLLWRYVKDDVQSAGEDRCRVADFRWALAGPEAPVIFPVVGVVTAWPVTITMSCATEGATIHYTTDGSEPTEESPVYSRFRISGRTTVKAIAIVNGMSSEVAVAEFAVGQCSDPVITPTDGSVFENSGQIVSIDWQGDDGTLRYTTDGSDPTPESPAYSEPFTIDETTIVKAKAFGDLFLDSAVVTANLMRVWINVAKPIITAIGSFSGSKTKVMLSCATEGATIRYTLNGNEPNSHSARYTGPFFVTNSCVVKAYAVCSDYLASEVASFAIEKNWGIGDTLGVPDHAFSTGGDLPFVRVDDATAPFGESMKSGAITHEQVSTLSTTVMGPGTISFQWKTSCEKDPDDLYLWDHAEFYADGTLMAQLDGETAWQTVSQAISGTGSHTLEWLYIKDDIESVGADCCWVADYHWASDCTATQTTPESVPYVWLLDYFPETPDEYDFYESAALATAANGVNKVWECYVAGISPTNAAARFEARIEVTNGVPVVTWTPDLNVGGTKRERAYTVEGKANLTDASWGPTNAASRFFRVKVGMPE